MNSLPPSSSPSRPPNKAVPPSADEGGRSTWGMLIGGAIGLLATFLIGRWAANAVMGGLVGFFIGALIDRSRS